MITGRGCGECTAGSFMIKRERPTMYFFGVTTSQSSSLRAFPAWAEAIGYPKAQLLGVDLPLNAPAEQYREAVEQIKYDPLSLGALVTSHKLNTLRAARDLFVGLSDDAALCDEISCIYKRDGKLLGYAGDPYTSERSMARFIPPGYWREHQAEVLCFGGGGAAVAICVHFAAHRSPEDRPRRIVVVDIKREKLDHLRHILEDKLPPSGIGFDYVLNADPRENDRLMAGMPPRTLVINATGMGKDLPGSPITNAAVFPEQGIAWELNYRGELNFWHQARAQVATRDLRVEDGWHYFIEGWANVISKVFDVEITPAIFQQFAKAAEVIR